ncbi:hypothetical protein ACP275_09G106400 [Erythranthe tilingii]
MSTAFPAFQTPIFSSASSAAAAAPANNHRSLKVSAQSNSWWSPLFGWSSDPDYINGAAVNKIEAGRAASGQSENNSGRAGPDRSLFRGCFTEEKARELRKKTVEFSNFHDIMYHSAIASRLASDVPGGDER